ncbi:hypothetical protein [Eudoraea chungangensis]|uniref:hypothetical protein n=1 Tax=Eudoraea chungangensis TaxID=1481905 RepID=UPI0023EAF677|nr:hypothetical protein [Eudoraea chungangensis]
MKSQILTLTIGILIGLSAMYGFNTFTKTSVSAFQELPEEFYTILYQNDNVRIIEHVLEPGEIEPMHNHPPMYVYVMEGAKILRHGPDGSRKEQQPTIAQKIELTNPISHSL